MRKGLGHDKAPGGGGKNSNHERRRGAYKIKIGREVLKANDNPQGFPVAPHHPWEHWDANKESGAQLIVDSQNTGEGERRTGQRPGYTKKREKSG